MRCKLSYMMKINDFLVLGIGADITQSAFLEEEMAAHSSILAWRIPWTEEPGGLQSMGSQESGKTA